MQRAQKYPYQRAFQIQKDGRADLPETLAAHDAGFEEGKQAGIAQMQDRIHNILLSLDQQIHMLNTAQIQDSQYIHGEVLETCQAILTKLFPYLQEKYMTQEVASFVQASLKFLKKEGALTVAVHPQNYDPLASRLAEIKPALTLMEDPDLGPCDCRVSWDSGGIEKLTSDVHAHIMSALESLQHTLPARACDTQAATKPLSHHGDIT